MFPPKQLLTNLLHHGIKVGNFKMPLNNRNSKICERKFFTWPTLALINMTIEDPYAGGIKKVGGDRKGDGQDQ